MNKSAFLLLMVLGSTFATPWVSLVQPPKRVEPKRPDLDLCPVCIQFAGEFINELLNIILNAGVVGSCTELCNLLAEKVGSKTVGEVCDILCTIVGVELFIKIIEEADLDPIYYCELLKACPVKDNGDAKITSVTVTPKEGPQGQFMLGMTFTSKNGTGTGEIDVVIGTVDGIPVASSFLEEEKPPGSYSMSVKLNAQPNPDCDPSQGPCEEWLPGVYNVTFAICNGECGSKHPHSKVYDTASTKFTITGK